MRQVVRSVLFVALAPWACSSERVDAQETAKTSKGLVVRASKELRHVGRRLSEATGPWSEGLDVEKVSDALSRAMQPPPPTTSDDDDERWLDEAGSAIACAKDQCSISDAFARRARARPDLVAGQLRARPVYQDGHTIGIEVSAFDEHSVPGRLGFQPGDIVTYVNGVAVGHPQQAIQLAMQLRAARRFRVDFLRDGQAKTTTVAIE